MCVKLFIFLQMFSLNFLQQKTSICGDVMVTNQVGLLGGLLAAS